MPFSPGDFDWNKIIFFWNVLYKKNLFLFLASNVRAISNTSHLSAWEGTPSCRWRLEGELLDSCGMVKVIGAYAYSLFPGKMGKII